MKIKTNNLFFLLAIALISAFFIINHNLADIALAQVNEALRTTKKIYIKTTQVIKPNSTIKLSVKFHRQEHSLSCEVAALKMALNYKGVKVSENELIKKLPFAEPKIKKNNTWGDPNIGFVGNIDGKMPNTGYGVYAKPIVVLANDYRPAKIVQNAGLNDLIIALEKENPIVVWTVIGPTKDISWKTPDGKKIKAFQIEHAQVLIGYTGNKDNIKKIILLDPIYGEIYWDKQLFLNRWEILDRQAIVIE